MYNTGLCDVSFIQSMQHFWNSCFNKGARGPCPSNSEANSEMSMFVHIVNLLNNLKAPSCVSLSSLSFISFISKLVLPCMISTVVSLRNLKILCSLWRCVLKGPCHAKEWMILFQSLRSICAILFYLPYEGLMPSLVKNARKNTFFFL